MQMTCIVIRATGTMAAVFDWHLNWYFVYCILGLNGN